jgi:transposase-like protein
VAGADRMTIEEVVRRVLLDEHADVIREAVKAVAAEMMEIEVSELIGAGHGERRPEDRATHRNGYIPARFCHLGRCPRCIAVPSLAIHSWHFCVDA